MKLKIVGAALLTAAFALSAVGCQKGVRPGGESVVQIRAWKAGFGDEWLNAAVDEFNKMYADEGYSAKIEESAGTITTEEVVSQTKDYKKNNIDLYFASGSAAILELVDASAQILRTSDYTLLEDLSDVYESGAIGFNKQVETESIESKISDSADYFLAYNGKVDKWKGTRFLYQWTSASSGFVYNKKVVDSYLGGEVPRTTNELKVAFDKILSEGKADNVYPVAWGGNNAAGYWQYVTETWFAQYAGEDDYYDFYRLKPESGDTIKEGWKVYDNKGWLYAFENLETFCDSGYAAPGTLTTVDNLGAQDLLLKGKAAFCTSGDWMYNEMCNDPSYEKYLPDIRIMRVPVMSQLGEKLKLHSNPDTCDKILSEVIKGVDENKTDEEIISAVRSAYSVTLDGAQVEEIRAARGIYYDLIDKYNDLFDKQKKERLLGNSYILCSKTIKTCEQLKEHLIESKLELVNKMCCAIFNQTVRKESYLSAIEIDSSFKLKLFSDDQEVSLNYLSAGETQLLVSCIIWAMFKVSGRRELFVFDTPLARLDEENRLAFSNNIVCTISNQVIILSTDSEFIGKNYEMIADKVAIEYLLDYDDKNKITKVKAAYFGDVKK